MAQAFDATAQQAQLTERAIRVQLDQRRTRNLHVGPDVVAEFDRQRAEHLERFTVGHRQSLYSGETVDDGRRSTWRIVGDGVQELDAGYRSAVRLVGVRGQRDRRVRKVDRHRIRPHIEQVSKVRRRDSTNRSSRARRCAADSFVFGVEAKADADGHRSGRNKDSEPDCSIDDSDHCCFCGAEARQRAEGGSK